MDDYDLGPELGQGGFGTVYRVTRKSDNRQLAAKRICLTFLKPEEKQRAFDEAKNIATMKHPNICAFEDSFTECINGQDYLYIIMECCAGGSLQSRIRAQQGEPFRPDQIMQWLHSICLVLAHVHRRRGIHRDLKPENIFLTAEGVVKVGDFGIAVVATTTLAAGKTKIGTLHYLAPEVIDADEEEEETYDYHCDLWSLGVVLYELITLKLPFQAKSALTLGKKICSGVYEPLCETTPKELRDLVEELLNKDPSRRPDCTEIISRDFFKQRQLLTPNQNPRDSESQMRDLRVSTPEPAEKTTTKKALTEAEKNLINEWEGTKLEQYQKRAANNKGATVLHFVSEDGQINVVSALLARGDSVNATNDIGRTPLHEASYAGYTHVVTLLIQNGARVDHKDNIGWTPLHQASSEGEAEAAEALIKAGADFNAKADKEWHDFPVGSTPLHMANARGNTEVVIVLLRNKADKNIKNSRGQTPRDVICTGWRVHKSQLDAIRRLMDE